MTTAYKKIVDEIVLSLVDFHLDNKANVKGWKFVGNGMEDDEYPDIGIYVDYEWEGEDTGYVYIMDEEEADELETKVKVAIATEFLQVIYGGIKNA